MVLACFSNAVAQASYTVTDLGTLHNGSLGCAMAVNNHGWTEIMDGNVEPGDGRSRRNDPRCAFDYFVWHTSLSSELSQVVRLYICRQSWTRSDLIPFVQKATGNEQRTSLISLTFDDGLRCQFERALPILNKYGIPATFFLIANQEPTYGNRQNEWWKIDWRNEDVAMLRKVVQEGHEIGSHSVTHDRTKMPKQPDFEARESKRLIENWIGTEVTSFCYPYYHTYEYLGEAVRTAGYEQARMGAQHSYYPLSAPLSFDVDCRQVSKNDNVKEWIQPERWHVLAFHGIGGERSGWEPVP